MSTSERRGRGRPPRSDGAETRVLLLDAAAQACAEVGFDGATLAEITARAGMTATAVYNHFDSRENLLYEAGVAGLRSMTDAVRRTDHASFADVALAYLHPDMARTRRLLAELHLAGRRDDRLAELLETWHRDEAESLAAHRVDDPDAMATIKALFLLLLGLCHLDDLSAVEADRDAMVERVVVMAEALGSFDPARSHP